MISGSDFSSNMADITVEIDGVNCAVTSASTTSVQCTTGSIGIDQLYDNIEANSGQQYSLKLHIDGMGYADNQGNDAKYYVKQTDKINEDCMNRIANS